MYLNKRQRIVVEDSEGTLTFWPRKAMPSEGGNYKEVAADGVPTELCRAKMRQVQGGDSIQFESLTVTGVP